MRVCVEGRAGGVGVVVVVGGGGGGDGEVGAMEKTEKDSQKSTTTKTRVMSCHAIFLTFSLSSCFLQSYHSAFSLKNKTVSR